MEDARFGDLTGVRGRLIRNAPLAPFTWFQVGGPADLLFQPADADDLAFFLQNLPADVPLTVVGVGSNLLVRDGGVDGVVIRLSAKGFGQIVKEAIDRLRAGAAALDKRVAAFALENKLAGFAFYHGIPGTIGGALRMNAGASGGETRDRLIKAYGVDRKGARRTFTNAEMDFSYRHTGAPSDVIFTEALFQGTVAAREAIDADMQAVAQHREAAQPIREKTGGSTFVNPEAARAWELIDKAGCRGMRIGGALVSEMHCNFLINTGSASATDIETLGETVRSRVLADSGIRLEWEIKRIGRFRPGYEVAPFMDAEK
jgi:UDP-N-acetylmuramate dehydrogenase